MLIFVFAISLYVCRLLINKVSPKSIIFFSFSIVFQLSERAEILVEDYQILDTEPCRDMSTAVLTMVGQISQQGLSFSLVSPAVQYYGPCIIHPFIDYLFFVVIKYHPCSLATFYVMITHIRVTWLIKSILHLYGSKPCQSGY